jgi:hypothetical protein
MPRPKPEQADLEFLKKELRAIIQDHEKPSIAERLKAMSELRELLQTQSEIRGTKPPKGMFD